MGLGMLAACVPTLPSFGKLTKDNEKKIKRLIFYFSATGNSLYTARQIGGEEASLLSISQEIHNEHPDYEAEEIGFVCPVYCFLPPAIVQDFIARSSFKADYFFAVGTYGAHSTIFPEFLNDFAKKNGVQMNFISTIQMVDTYLPYFDVERELADPKLQRIPERLAAVHASVNKRENYIQPVTEQDRMICDGYYRMSGRDRQRPTVTRSEKIVFATDACIGRMVLGKWLTGTPLPMVTARIVWHVFTTVRRKPFPLSLHHQNPKSRTAMHAIAIRTSVWQT